MAQDRVFLVLEAGSTLVGGMSHELGTYTLLAKKNCCWGLEI